MAKTLILVCLFFVLCSPVMAAQRITLQDGDDAEVGTASNPIECSFSGEQVIAGTLEVQGDDPVVNFTDVGTRAEMQVDDTLVMDLSMEGNTMVRVAGDLVIANDLTLSNPLTVTSAGYYLTWDDKTKAVGINDALELSRPVTISGAGYYFTWDETTQRIGITKIPD